MNIIANNIRLQFTESGKAEIILCTDTNRMDISELKEVVAKGKTLAVEIKQHRQKRSLDSNAYLWTLCQKIAEVIRSTKEEVYKKAIREVGQFEVLAVKEEAAEQFIKVWNSRGLGWYAEDMDSKLDGCKKIIAYYGSSCYDTKAMSVLVDYIVEEAKGLNIETLPPQEIESMKREWGGIKE